METEHNSVLTFLDVSVHRSFSTFQTSVYRKQIFSGIGMSDFSFCCKIFKINCLRTLLHRAYNISFNYQSLHLDFSFLQKFFHANGYSKLLVDHYILKFLNTKFKPSLETAQVPGKTYFFPMLYFGHKSVVLKAKLIELINNFFPHLDVKIILVNPNSIGSFFKSKDTVP